MTTAVYTVRADGSGETRLTDPGLVAGSPDWSPDGAWIVFSTYPLNVFQGGGDSQLYRVHPDGTVKEFRQYIARSMNDRGSNELARYATPYADGEQRVEYEAARVHRKGGAVEEALDPRPLAGLDQIRGATPQEVRGRQPQQPGLRPGLSGLPLEHSRKQRPLGQGQSLRALEQEGRR